MSKIFQQQKQWAKRPPRNNFDLSYDNNFTTKIGQLTPVFVKECMPGDKFSIDASIGLRAMPLAFPVQSPLQAHLSYFWVPNRILWDSWKDFVSDTQEHEHPYISIPYTRATEIATGTLADYLGIPTTYANNSGNDYLSCELFGSKIGVTSVSEPIGLITEYEYDDVHMTNSVGTIGSPETPPTSNTRQAPLNMFMPLPAAGLSFGYHEQPSGTSVAHFPAYRTDFLDFEQDGHLRFTCDLSGDFTVRVQWYDNVDDGNLYNAKNVYTDEYTAVFDVVNNCFDVDYSTDLDTINSLLTSSYMIVIGFPTRLTALSVSPSIMVGRLFVNCTDVSSLNNPFVIQEGDSVPDIKLNALPFRAYEAIYNSYYRNQTDVDPFIIGSDKQYNRWCTNLSDGADSTTPLYLRNVNYELDYLTSCLLSPQFGDAPLVGVNAIGEFTFEDEQGQTFKVIPRVGDDGDTLTGIDSYQEGTPVGSLQRLNSLIKYGISISDFRNVNSLQRFAENHLRRGLKYEDVIKSHFGTDMKYSSVDEPIYIGGMTRTIDVTQINATAQSDGIKLGDYVGQAGLFSKQKHNVNHYCDEFGFIVGVLSIVPIPTYSQLLPKMWLKDNLLSYPFPLEFRHIGMQPIDYREVTPIQAKVFNKPYSDTFGYQRPYYDFIASVDENHGNFRTDMQGYVFTRNFSEPPELGHDFIVVDPSQMTNPFIDVSPEATTFIGQIHFDVVAKRPLARIHQPALE